MAIPCPKCRLENPSGTAYCGRCGAKLDSRAAVSFTRTMETPPDDLVRGTVFAGRYEIIEELGTGGMGRVYRAHDVQLNEEVALKLIKPEIAAEKRVIERFRNELKVARKIRHPNVGGMYDLHEEGSTLYLTMEYVRGEDLKSLVHRTGVLAVATAVAIARQVAEGLGEAHKLGVVHRDLKPGNVMIDRDGQAKIMDFGIARAKREKAITGEGTLLGTPEYMAPEQVDGKAADGRSDLYALGVMLFEMLTGRAPFEGETPFSVAAKHKTEPPPNPRKLAPQIPEGLSRIILRCLEKDPERRYQTAEALAADLGAVEATIPAADRKPARRKTLTSREITVKFTPRKLAIPVLIAGFVIIAAVLGRRAFFKKEAPPGPKVQNSLAFISLRNQTGDKEYDKLCQREIPELLITNLENSGLFHVATWERMMDLMKQMGKKGGTSISDADGFEICRREGIKYIVAGSLTKAGDTLMTDLKILDAESKALFKGVQSRGRGDQSLLESQIDDLSRQICSGVGLGEDQIHAAPFRIADKLTSSLEAYEHYIRGLDYFSNYKFQSAQASFQRAAELDPGFASAFRWLAIAAMQYGDHAAAKRAAERARSLSSKATDKERLFIEVSLTAILGQDSAKNIPVLETLVAKYPKEKEAHYWLGLEFGKLKDFGRAIREMDRVVELDPNYAEAYNYLSIWHSLLGDFEKAVQFGETYASMLPDSGNPLDTLAIIYADGGRIEEAIGSWTSALAKDPKYFWAYEGLSYLAASKEDYPEATSWLDRLLAKKPPAGIEAEARLIKGFLEVWLGRIESALAEFKQAAKIAGNIGNDKMAWIAGYFEAVARSERGEFELSQKMLRQAFDHPPASARDSLALTKPELAYALAWNDLGLGRPDSARTRGKEMDAPWPDVAALTLWRIPSTGGWQKKMKFLSALLRSEIAIREGKADAESIRAALEALPAYAVGLMSQPNYGFIAAIDYLVLPPPLARDTLARAYAQSGQLDQAVAAYERLVAFDPKSPGLRWIHPLAHYRLALVYEETGRKRQAAASYKKFLAFWKDADPGRPEIEDARKKLAVLEQK